VPLLTDRNSILELLRSHPRQAGTLWIEAGHERTLDELIVEARRCGARFRVVSRDEFSRRFKGVRSHIVLEREAFGSLDPDSLLARMRTAARPFLAAFDGISDPQNLGNALRSAACLGLDALILPKDRSCSITDTVSRVSRGAAEHVTVVRVTNLHRMLEELKRANIFCYGLDEQAGKNLWELDLTIPICLVFGKEEGMRRLTRETCDEIVRIPSAAGFSTLNVATSFAIAAYEVRRQRLLVR
jgi:23S rRNA (guanosine2251-2'-O)-methyltransferase